MGKRPLTQNQKHMKLKRENKKYSKIFIQGNVPKVFGEDWKRKVHEFANTEEGKRLTEIFFDAFCQVSHQLLTQIGRVWEHIKKEMSFETLNKLLLSLLQNRKVNLGVNIIGKLVFVSWNREDYIRRMKEKRISNCQKE
jgi:hypothetical protein